MEKFREFLLFKKVIPDHQANHYLRWVNLFLRFCHSKTDLPPVETQIDLFLNDLTQKYKEWQVLQAKDAVSLYLFFIKKNTPISTKQSQMNETSEWKNASGRFIRMLRLKHRSYATERTYLGWLRAFYRFVKPLQPKFLEGCHVKDFLTHLAADRGVAKSTQNQAFNALLFFYRYVLDKEIGSLSNVVRSRKGRRLPSVLTFSEIMR